VILPDANFTRVGDDIYTKVYISPIDAMVGCRKQVKTLSGQTLDLDLRAGIEDGSEFASHGNGFPNVNTGHKGRFVSVIKIRTPAVTDPLLVERLRSINNEINKTS
jgi:molecular chaperone DnaJ